MAISILFFFLIGCSSGIGHNDVECKVGGGIGVNINGERLDPVLSEEQLVVPTCSSTLHSAIQQNRTDILKKLLQDEGANIDKLVDIDLKGTGLHFPEKGAVQMRALDFAAISLKKDCLSLLLSEGASANSSLGKYDPLEILCSYDKYLADRSIESKRDKILTVVKILIKNGILVTDQHFIMCGRYGNWSLCETLIGSTNINLGDNSNSWWYLSDEIEDGDMDKDPKALSGLMLVWQEGAEYGNERVFAPINNKLLLFKALYESCFFGKLNLVKILMKFCPAPAKRNLIFSACHGANSRSQSNLDEVVKLLGSYCPPLSREDLSEGINVEAYGEVVLMDRLAYVDKKLSGGSALGIVDMCYALAYFNRVVELENYIKQSSGVFLNSPLFLSLILHFATFASQQIVKTMYLLAGEEVKGELFGKLTLDHFFIYRLIDSDFSEEKHHHFLDRGLISLARSRAFGLLSQRKIDFIRHLSSKSGLTKSFVKLRGMGSEVYKKEEYKIFMEGLRTANDGEEFIDGIVNFFSFCNIERDDEFGIFFLAYLAGNIGGMEHTFKNLYGPMLNPKSGGGLAFKLKGALSWMVGANRDGCFHQSTNNLPPHNKSLLQILISGTIFSEVELLQSISRWANGCEKYIVGNINVLKACARSSGPETISVLLSIWDKGRDHCPDCLDLLLREAAIGGNTAGIKLLIERGANADAMIEGYPIVQHCIRSDMQKEKVDAVQTLMDYGADVTRKNIDGLDALEVALEFNAIAILEKFLIAQEGNSEWVKGFLKAVIMRGNVAVLRLLLEKDFMANDLIKNIAFDLAVQHGEEESAKLILLWPRNEIVSEKSLHRLLHEEGREDYLQILTASVLGGNRSFSLKLAKPKIEWVKNYQKDSSSANITLCWERVYGAKGSNISIEKKFDLINGMVVPLKKSKDPVIHKYRVGIEKNSVTVDLGQGIYEVILEVEGERKEDGSTKSCQMRVDNRPKSPQILKLDPTYADERLISINLEWSREIGINSFLLGMEIRDQSDEQIFSSEEKVAHNENKFYFSNLDLPLDTHLTLKLTAIAVDEEGKEMKSYPAFEELYLRSSKRDRESKEDLLLKFRGDLGNNMEGFYSALTFLERDDFRLQNLLLEENRFLRSFIVQKTCRSGRVDFATSKAALLKFAQDVDMGIAGIKNFEISSLEKLKEFLVANENLFEEKGPNKLERVEGFFDAFYSGSRRVQLEERVEVEGFYHRRRGVKQEEFRDMTNSKEEMIVKKVNRIIYCTLFMEGMEDSDKLNAIAIAATASECQADYSNTLEQAWDYVVKKLFSRSFNGLDEYIVSRTLEYVENWKVATLVWLDHRQSTHAADYLNKLLHCRYGLPLDNFISEDNSIIKDVLAKEDEIIEEMEETFSLKVFARYLLPLIKENDNVKRELMTYLNEKLPKPFCNYDGLMFSRSSNGSDDELWRDMEIDPCVIEALLIDKKIAILN